MFDWRAAASKKINSDTTVQWVRVSKHTPCTVCKKHDWCTKSNDGSVYCCMRVPSSIVLGNGGYLHKGEPVGVDVLSAPQQKRRSINPSAIMNRWSMYSSEAQVAEYASQLGVTPASLERLGCVRANHRRNALAFPMVNAAGTIVGIRLRHDNGSKSTVKGSRSGLFVPTGIGDQKILMICEGPTDTAAILDCGLDAIGRPSCLGQVSMIRQLLLKFNPCPDIVVCADRDGAGLDGARRLATGLIATVPNVRVIRPPKHNDVREWVTSGATKESVMCVTDKTKYWRG